MVGLPSQNYLAPDFRITVNGTAIPQEVRAHVTNVTVQGSPGKLTSLRIALSNPYPEMPWTHGGTLPMKPGDTVKVEMGYVGELKSLFSGKVTHLSADFPESGSPALNVQAFDHLIDLSLQTRTREYIEKTDSEIVRAIGSDNHLTVKADRTVTTHKYVLQDGISDLAFLIERAARNGFELFVDAGALHFQEPKDQSPVATLTWGSGLLSFKPEVSAAKFKGTVNVRWPDFENNGHFEGQASKGSGSGPSAKALKWDAGTPTRNAFYARRSASDAEAKKIAQAIYDHEYRGALTGTATCVGLPGLWHGKTLKLEGLGTYFNAVYRVTQATHSYSTTGYRTTVTLGVPLD